MKPSEGGRSSPEDPTTCPTSGVAAAQEMTSSRAVALGVTPTAFSSLLRGAQRCAPVHHRHFPSLPTGGAPIAIGGSQRLARRRPEIGVP
jgi:hypothetical protein